MGQGKTLSMTVLHLFETTRFSNHTCHGVHLPCVLHLFETTRFSNKFFNSYDVFVVLHLFETTRFSNLEQCSRIKIQVLHLFETTRFSNCFIFIPFFDFCFTLIRNHKVLKQLTRCLGN